MGPLNCLSDIKGTQSNRKQKQQCIRNRKNRKKSLLDWWGSKWFASVLLHQPWLSLFAVVRCAVPPLCGLSTEQTTSDLPRSLGVTAWISCHDMAALPPVQFCSLVAGIAVVGGLKRSFTSLCTSYTGLEDPGRICVCGDEQTQPSRTFPLLTNVYLDALRNDIKQIKECENVNNPFYSHTWLWRK